MSMGNYPVEMDIFDPQGLLAANEPPHPAPVAAEQTDNEVLAEMHGGLKLVDLPDQTDAEPEVADDPEPELPPAAQGEPSGLEELMERPADPFSRFGFDEVRANEIAAAARLNVPEEDIADFMQAMEKAGVRDEDSFRQFCGFVRQKQDDIEEKRAGRQEIEDIKAQIAERAAVEPGSPYAALNAKLDALLSDKQQREELDRATAQEQAFVEQHAPIHVSAFEMVAGEAQKRGLPMPDVQAMAQIHGQLLHLEPMQAAKLAWLGAGGDPGVFGPKTPSRERSRTIRGEVRSAPEHDPGSTARGLQRMLEQEDDTDERQMDNALRNFAGG